MTNSIAEALAKAERERLAKLAREQNLQGALSTWGREPTDPPEAPQPATTPEGATVAQERETPDPVQPPAPAQSPAPETASPPSDDGPDVNRKVKYVGLDDPALPLSEILFYTVRENPGVHRLQLRKELTEKGYNPNSVGALLAQMRRARMMRETPDGYLTTLVVKYKPPKGSTAYARSIEKLHKDRGTPVPTSYDKYRKPHRSNAEIAAASIARVERAARDTPVDRAPAKSDDLAPPAQIQAVDIRTMTAHDIVASLSFVQARDVRRMLNEMFAAD